MQLREHNNMPSQSVGSVNSIALSSVAYSSSHIKEQEGTFLCNAGLSRFLSFFWQPSPH